MSMTEIVFIVVGTVLGLATLYAGIRRERWNRPDWGSHVVQVAFAGGCGVWWFLSQNEWVLIPAGVFTLAVVVWLLKRVTSYFVKPPSVASDE